MPCSIIASSPYLKFPLRGFFGKGAWGKPFLDIFKEVKPFFLNAKTVFIESVASFVDIQGLAARFAEGHFFFTFNFVTTAVHSKGWPQP